MKRFFDVRFCYVIVLMVLSSSACAGQTFSFVVGRHRVRIEDRGIAILRHAGSAARRRSWRSRARHRRSRGRSDWVLSAHENARLLESSSRRAP